jgi:hypothetical protein
MTMAPNSITKSYEYDEIMANLEVGYGLLIYNVSGGTFNKRISDVSYGDS